MFFKEMFDYFNEVMNTIDDAKKAYVAYSELNSLTDQELAMLGLRRNEIPKVALESVKNTQ